MYSSVVFSIAQSGSYHPRLPLLPSVDPNSTYPSLVCAEMPLSIICAVAFFLLFYFP